MTNDQERDGGGLPPPPGHRPSPPGREAEPTRRVTPPPPAVPPPAWRDGRTQRDGPAWRDGGSGEDTWGAPGYGRRPDDPSGRYRAMTLADVLDGMFRLIKDHWRTFLLAVGAVLVPLSLLTNIVLAALAPELIVPDFAALFDPEAMAAGEPPFGTGVLVALAAVSALSFLLVTPISWSVCAVVAEEAVAGRDVDAGGAVGKGLRRFPAVLGVFLLQALAVIALVAIVAAGTFVAVQAVGNVGALVVLPLLLVWLVAAVWLYVRWSLAVPVAVIEQAGPVQSLRRSWRLTGRRFWWLLGTLLLVTIVATVVGSIAATPFQMLSLASGSATFVAAVLVSLGSVVSGLITTPVTVNALTLLYTDRRVRQEGADLLPTPGHGNPDAGTPPW